MDIIVNIDMHCIDIKFSQNPFQKGVWRMSVSTVSFTNTWEAAVVMTWTSSVTKKTQVSNDDIFNEGNKTQRSLTTRVSAVPICSVSSDPTNPSSTTRNTIADYWHFVQGRYIQGTINVGWSPEWSDESILPCFACLVVSVDPNDGYIRIWSVYHRSTARFPMACGTWSSLLVKVKNEVASRALGVFVKRLPEHKCQMEPWGR